MKDALLPHAILIGPYKSGSTFLRAFFSAHPDIQWSRHAHFLQNDTVYKRIGNDLYLDRAGPGKLVVDMFEGIATGYLYPGPEPVPLSFRLSQMSHYETDGLRVDHQELARRISTISPDIKVIILMREQVAWLRSVYHHFIEHMESRDRSFITFLRTLEGKTALSAGMFDRTIEAYCSQLSSDRVLTVQLERMVSQPDSVFIDLCEFLGVPPIKNNLPESAKNTGKDLRAGVLIRLFSRLGLEKDDYEKIRPYIWPIKNVLKYLVPNRDPINRETRALLQAIYSVSNYRSSQMINIDLSELGYST